MDKTPASQRLAWHYTHASNLPGIKASGVQAQHTSPNSYVESTFNRPAIWFTMNEFVEPTKWNPLREARDRMAGCTSVSARMRLLHEAAGSGGWRLARFGYPAALLVDVGSDMLHKLDARGDELQQEERQVIADWRISLKNIAVADCHAIDFLSPDLIWQPAWTKPGVASLGIMLDTLAAARALLGPAVRFA